MTYYKFERHGYEYEVRYFLDLTEPIPTEGLDVYVDGEIIGYISRYGFVIPDLNAEDEDIKAFEDDIVQFHATNQ